MSEAEKKPAGKGDSGDDSKRTGNVKPFPDFIVTAPGGTAAGGGTADSQGQGSGPVTAPSGPAARPTSPVTPVASSVPPVRKGGGGWAFLFALVSLTAAGVSLSGPSLRPLVSTELKARFGDQRWIDILTGAADTRSPSVVQLDLKQFDQRLDALATTLTTANPGAPVDGATLARFADAAGATQRMADFESAINSLKAKEGEHLALMTQAIERLDGGVGQLHQRTEALEASSGHLTEQIKAAGTQAEKLAEIAQTADTASKELATSLGGAMQKLAATETALTELGTKLTSLNDGLGGRVTQAMEPLTARVGDIEKTSAANLDGVRQDLGVVTGTLAEISGQLKAMDAAGALQDGRLETLTQQTESLTRNLGVAATTVAALDNRLAGVEKKLEKPSAAAVSTLLGLTNRLHTAIDDGEPFAQEVAMVKALAGDDPAFSAPLAALAPLAPRGVPSLIVLRREFNNTARRVVEAEEATQPTWYQRQWSSLGYYLGWTRNGNGPDAALPDSARPALAQAAAAINNGQFGEAVGSLTALHGSGAELAAPWVVAARARVAADEAVKALARATMGRLAP